MSARPSAVICDFGGVLTNPLHEAFIAWQERSGIPVADLGTAMADAAEAAGGEHPLFALERGEISEREFLARLERALGGGRSLAEFSEVWFENLRPNRPMIDFMRDLRGRGLRMALLTNNVREWEPRWRAKLPEIDEIFETVVDSAFVGMRKPEPEIYRLTLRQLGGGIEPADCVFLDDVDPNCDAAAALGMRAVRFVDNAQAIAEVEAALTGEVRAA